MMRLCGAALGLFAFAISIALGLAVGNPAEVVLRRAIQALLIFCVIGLFAGWVIYRVLGDRVPGKNHKMSAEAQKGRVDELEDSGTEPLRPSNSAVKDGQCTNQVLAGQ